MKKIFLLLLFICSFSNAQTASDYSKLAKADLDSRMYSKAKENATKAIELDPTNIDSRWIRIRASLTSVAKADDYKIAISDLEFLTTAGDVSEKTYKSLGLAYRDYAGILDRQLNDYKTASNFYLKAKEAYQKAKNISGDTDYNYDIKDVSELLNEVKQKEKTTQN